MGILDGKKGNDDARAEAGRQHSRLPRGGKLAVGTVLSLGSAGLAIVYRASFLEARALLDATHVLLVAVGLGWIGRSVIHGCVGYFRRTMVEGVNPYVLIGVSCVNASFAIAWLVAGIFLLLSGGGALLTATAAGSICLVAFLLSLATHWAARMAGLPRASEWVRDRVRDPLEPGGSTLPGWFLIKLIDWRSAPHYLSTFVAGTLAVLLVIILLAGSAAISARVEDRDAESPAKTSVEEGGRHDKGEQTDPAQAGPPKQFVGQAPQTVRKTTQLLCFVVQPSSLEMKPKQLFVCIVMAGGRTTNQSIILAPPSSQP
jgi:hypothetical protein